jgi:hypothetical protein
MKRYITGQKIFEKEGRIMDGAIIGYVKRSHEEYPDDHSKYKMYLKKMQRIDLSRFTEQDVEIILKPFLYKWGKMGRVLGEDKCKGWESDIVEPIRSNSNKLDEFRTINFESTSLTDFQNDIIKCYESLKTIVDRVAATKTMHIICPNFFPLWDNDIVGAVRSEATKMLAGTDKTELIRMIVEKIDDFSGKDYYRFMLLLQDFFERYKNTFLNLAKTYEKSVVKILDDFLWMIAHRPLSLFLQRTI